MTEAYCDCTGSPTLTSDDLLAHRRPNRFYLCPECGAMKEDVYQDGAIVEHRWQDTSHGALLKAMKEGALEVLELPVGSSCGRIIE